MSKKENIIVIVPSCSDLNRGDQALVWESKRVAEAAGFHGQFYFQTEKNEPVEQSEAQGLKPIYPILEHPSRKFKKKNNIAYTKSLKIKWGVVAAGDFLGSLFLLWRPTRNIAKLFMGKEKKRALYIIEHAKAVFMKGGGLLQTYGGVSSTYSMYFWTYPLILAKAMKKPVYILPNSFGPFEGPLVKKIAHHALKDVKVLTSRESISQEMVEKDLSLKNDLIIDLAFGLPKANLKKEDVFARYDLPMDRKLVALTMRPYRFPHSNDPQKAYEDFKSEMAKFITWLYDSGYMPVIVEHTRAVNEHENDGACIKEVTTKVKNGKYRIISNKDYSCYDLKQIYSFCDYIVGTRFHSMIFSFGSEVPGIAISYTGNKSIGIMHDMGLDDYVIDIANVTFDRLKKRFEKLIGERTAVVQKIRRYKEKAESDRNKLILECKKA